LNTENYDVAVIGGGASGMIAAGRAAELGARVILFDKNRVLGEKVRITGGGRCNITNAEFDRQILLSSYGSAKDFLFSPFSQFGVQDTFDFFAKLGLPLVVEARQRAFPATQKAEDVVFALEKYMKSNRVTIKLNAGVTRVVMKKDKIAGVMADGVEYSCKSLIVATGGLSHPETGSTGDGMRWLARLGHTVREPSPDVVPLSVAEEWIKSLSGVSLSFMKITFFLDGKKAFSKTGKILFTHFGLSSPLIINSASKVKELLSKGKVTATIDSFPDTDLGSLEKQIVKVFDASKNKDLKNIFDQIAPAGTDKAILSILSGVDPNEKVHSITKDQRKNIVHLLKALPVTITGLMGYDRAIVSDGGVALAEIDTRTMCSKIHPNLFITGDLLDINRQSGGFSLQLCWTTGYVAGTHAVDVKKDRP